MEATPVVARGEGIYLAPGFVAPPLYVNPRVSPSSLLYTLRSSRCSPFQLTRHGTFGVEGRRSGIIISWQDAEKGECRRAKPRSLP